MRLQESDYQDERCDKGSTIIVREQLANGSIKHTYRYGQHIAATDRRCERRRTLRQSSSPTIAKKKVKKEKYFSNPAKVRVREKKIINAGLRFIGHMLLLLQLESWVAK